MTSNKLGVRRADLSDLEAVVPLFDGYRQFYQQAGDVPGARAFLQARLEQRDSVLFLAEIDGRAAGFTQLYPSFSSVSMKRLWILNDLFTHPDYRRRGVGRALLTHAEQFAREDGAKGLALSTAKTNATAKATYEQAGWKQELVFDHYYRYF
jgi:ribosomal protein S18 acetylase RimI-like enzyme